MPRFAAVNLDSNADGPEYRQIVQDLADNHQQRTDFLKACLTKLGLMVSKDDSPVPSLSRLHLSSLRSVDVSSLLASLKDVMIVENGEEYIKGENDIFHLQKSSTWSMSSLGNALPGHTNEKTGTGPPQAEDILDYDSVIKRLVVHEKEYPNSKETPSFNHHAFYASLKHYQTQSNSTGAFGKYLLYGEVVTSTSTMLEKYYYSPLHEFNSIRTKEF